MTGHPPFQTRPKQSLGQNFLVDDNIARKIVGSMNISPTDVILEIGPGRGALTQHLAAVAREVGAIELDGRIAGELQTKFHSSNVEILHQDFLETDLSEWRKRFGKRLRVVGNIPYHLTSPILFKIFHERSSVEDLTIMIQREVALRITAKPGSKDYGILSVFSEFYGAPKRLFSVSPNCFYPKPKVTSTVIRLTLRQDLCYDVDEQVFTTIVKTAFGKRRKTLRNGLTYLPYDETVMDAIRKKVDFPLDKRPEQLTVAQFVQLSQLIDRIIIEEQVTKNHRSN